LSHKTRKSLECKHSNKHGNRLSEKPTAHQAGRQYNMTDKEKMKLK